MKEPSPSSTAARLRPTVLVSAIVRLSWLAPAAGPREHISVGVRRAVRHIAALLFASFYCAGATNQQFGVVGIFVSDSDYGLVSAVADESPAGAAGVVAGDRLLAIGPHDVAALKTPEEFRHATSGPVGESVTVRIRRARDGSVITLRLRRIAPDTLKPKTTPPYSDMRFFANATPIHLTMRCS